MRNNRNINQLRDIEIIPNFSCNPEGSCLIKCGDTHVICSASLDRNLPRWLKNSETGWVTAEYGMLPRQLLRECPEKPLKANNLVEHRKSKD